MLNPFPELLLYSMLGPTILRLVLGLVFLDLGIINMKKDHYTRILGIVEVVGAVMMIIGFYTQIAAIVFVLISLFGVYMEYQNDKLLKRDIVFYLLLLAISLSLLLTGAGSYAKDLPL